jgi:hypothetical protein
MAVSPNSIITPQNPYHNFANLIAATALTSRAPISGTTGLTALVPTQTNGIQINQIRVKISGSSTSGSNVAVSIFVWIYNGTTSTLFDEIVLGTTSASATAASYQTDVYYNGLILPSTHSMYVSESVATLATVSGPVVHVFGGLL